MGGHEQELLAEIQRPAARQGLDAPLLVAGLGEGEVGPVVDRGHATIEIERLHARIHIGDPVRRAAHHAGEHKQALGERPVRPASPVPVAGVVAIHEDIGARLDLGEHAERAVILEGARAASGDERAGEALGRQKRLCARRPPGHLARRRGALAGLSQMLEGPAIGLEPAQLQARCRRHRTGHGQKVVQRKPHARVARIDLHQNFDLDSVAAGGGRQLGHMAQIRSERRHPRRGREGAEAGELVRAHHVVGGKQVGNAARHHGLRLGDLLAAQAHGARGKLTAGDLDAFVGLGMGPERHGGGTGGAGHGGDIGLQRVEVHHQSGGVHLREAIAGTGDRRPHSAAAAAPSDRDSCTIPALWARCSFRMVARRGPFRASRASIISTWSCTASAHRSWDFLAV